jgi:G3E family GTPase
MKYIPTLLLTGYLGSGKTTLVNRILSNKRGIKFAVIVNDLGEVNIDADLIQKGGIVGQKDDSLVALQNGCICCTLKMDLVQQLREIVDMRRFDYIVIEASGICEPAPIAQTICSVPQVYPDFCENGAARLDCIVTVVDALRMKDEFKNGGDLLRKDIGEDDIENLLIQQIEFCNIILLNKADEVSASDKKRLYDIIRGLQPKAEIIECNYGDVDLDKIVNTRMFDFDDVAGSATWVQEIEKHHDDDDDDDEHDEDHDHEHEHEHHHHDEHELHHHDEHEHHHHEHHHHHEGLENEEEGEAEEYGVGTFVYQRRRPMEMSRFDDFVARLWPKNIIRAKGMCWFKDEDDTCYLFEQAGHQVSLSNAGKWFATMPENQIELLLEQQPQVKADWDENVGDRMQKLVFIGQHLDKEYIAQCLDRCLVDA